MLQVKANILPEDKANIDALNKMVDQFTKVQKWAADLEDRIDNSKGETVDSPPKHPMYGPDDEDRDYNGFPHNFDIPDDDSNYFTDLINKDIDEGGTDFASDELNGQRITDPVYQAFMDKIVDLTSPIWDLSNQMDTDTAAWFRDAKNNVQDGNPLRFSAPLVKTLQKFSILLIGIIPKISKIIQDWEEEAAMRQDAKLDSKNEDTMVGEGSRSLLYIRSLAETADQAYESVKQAAGKKTTVELKRFLKIFAQAQETIKTAPGITHSDIAAIQSQIGNLSEIANRAFFDDIRSWNGRAIQQQDALHLFTTMKLHWLKRLESLESDVKANKNGLFAGVPNYRFKVGQMVRVNSSRRYGKVLSISRKGGTGTQQYEVRVNGIDSSKIFGVRELSKVD